VYAIIADSGKQYRVEEGKYLYTEKQKEKQPGDEIVFEKVLMLKKDDGEVLVGRPYLSNVVVKGKVVEHRKARKVRGIKFRPRKNSKTTKNHRQWYTTILVEKIEVK
jgi:large subunit ribosomal protein L21